jgi:recombination protein RecA|tara:strand:+ start:2680 stop:3789 length:1110 start_codon:yes stop_codon:yes gene_type:complete
MAKKDFTFDDLNKQLADLNPLGSVMDKSNFSEVTEWIPTGNYHLNACVSGSLFGGWPNNRSCSVAGPSGTGKTFLTLNSVREAINMGYNIIYYDSEAAVDKDQMIKFGIDISKVNYQPVNTVQEFRTSITTITHKMQEIKREGGKIPKLMIILDSAGNLATQKEIDDAASGSEKSDMTRSKILKSIFRIIMTPLADLKIPFIFTNHTYQSQSFIPMQIAGGGTGPEYAASIVLMLNKAQLKDGADKVGIIVTAKPTKNRFAKPTPIKFHLNFSEGMNAYVGLEQYATWDICGITKGTIEKGKKVPKATARGWICEHLDETVPNKDFFTEKVFTREVLERIETHIKPLFNYNSESSSLDIEEMLEDANAE